MNNATEVGPKTTRVQTDPATFAHLMVGAAFSDAKRLEIMRQEASKKK